MSVEKPQLSLRPSNWKVNALTIVATRSPEETRYFPGYLEHHVDSWLPYDGVKQGKMPKHFLKDFLRPPPSDIWFLAYSMHTIYENSLVKRNVFEYKPWCKYVLTRKKNRQAFHAEKTSGTVCPCDCVIGWGGWLLLWRHNRVSLSARDWRKIKQLYANVPHPHPAKECQPSLESVCLVYKQAFTGCTAAAICFLRTSVYSRPAVPPGPCTHTLLAGSAS